MFLASTGPPGNSRLDATGSVASVTAKQRATLYPTMRPDAVNYARLHLGYI